MTLLASVLMEGGRVHASQGVCHARRELRWLTAPYGSTNLGTEIENGGITGKEGANRAHPTPAVALSVRCFGALHRQADDGNPSRQASRRLRDQPQQSARIGPRSPGQAGA